ncbi:MAG: endonuclease III [Spirochaetaceae bacterium]|jgi:endonuclease-3|nr:endonuclease III [Spirochaetaceae bacterium]
MPAGKDIGASGKTGPAKQNPDWEGIVGSLKKWRRDLQKGETAAPSVSTVAERYKKDPWAVLVSTILSLRTKDEVTLRTSRALLAKAPDPGAMLALDEDAIAALAYPAGFYRTKAANLKKIAAIVLEKYQGRVPSDLEALLELPGVGRKTANLVITEAYNKDGICVDVHVHRISNRTGWLSSRTPEETEMILRRILPRKYWKSINPLLVLYGQNLCRPVSPFCSRCIITRHCGRISVDTSR